MELEFLTQIVLLFGEEAFRHWFFWTAVILSFLGWTPYSVVRATVGKTVDKYVKKKAKFKEE